LARLLGTNGPLVPYLTDLSTEQNILYELHSSKLPVSWVDISKSFDCPNRHVLQAPIQEKLKESDYQSLPRVFHSHLQKENHHLDVSGVSQNDFTLSRSQGESNSMGSPTKQSQPKIKVMLSTSAQVLANHPADIFCRCARVLRVLLSIFCFEGSTRARRGRWSKFCVGIHSLPDSVFCIGTRYARKRP
jgi:hypothetical protein